MVKSSKALTIFEIFVTVCCESFLESNSLREKWPYSELFWSAFSHIRTGYRKMRTRITPNTDTFYAMTLLSILAPCKTNLDHSSDLRNFSVRVFFSFNSKGLRYSYTWSCRLCEVETSFSMWLGPWKLYQSPPFSLSAVIDTVSSSIIS